MLLKFGFQGFYFLLSVKFLLAKGLAGLKLVILQHDGEELSAFPASVRTLVEWVGQRQATLGFTFGTFNFNYHSFDSLLYILVASYY